MTNSDKVVEDGYGGCWSKCDRPDCDLHVVRPGKVQCKCEFECSCGGEIEYHSETDPRWPNFYGWYCSKGGPFCGSQESIEDELEITS